MLMVLVLAAGIRKMSMTDESVSENLVTIKACKTFLLY